MQNSEWDAYWNDIIINNKLNKTIEMLDQIDEVQNRLKRTKDICKNIYDNYQSIESSLKEVEEKTIILLKEIDNVYLQSSRVKTVDSLIVKVINRRYKYINSQKSRYNRIDDDNYTVTFKNYYIEIQLRPLFMEQWCMCSHNYVYKKEANNNHIFLENMSRTLENMTDMSGEIGDLMKAVYEGKYYVKANGNAFLMNENGIKCVEKLLEMCNNSLKELETLKNRIELESK